jgi:hypothetical protein
VALSAYDRKNSTMKDQIQTDVASLPIACSLNERERTERERVVAGDIMSGVKETRELVDGYAFCFPGEDPWPERINACVMAERRCCPFFTFELTFHPAQGPIWLRLHGLEGTKAFVEETFLRRSG